MKVCSIGGCETAADTRGMCRKHYTRWLRHGDPQQVVVYSKRTKMGEDNGYIGVRCADGGYQFEHVVMAEKALGRPLPPEALVHHIDRDGTNNNTKTPWNLVVCPDQSYHMLLHARARALGYEPRRKGYILSPQQEVEIRKSDEPRAVLASRYGVTVSTIKEVRSTRRGQELVAILSGILPYAP